MADAGKRAIQDSTLTGSELSDMEWGHEGYHICKYYIHCLNAWTFVYTHTAEQLKLLKECMPFFMWDLQSHRCVGTLKLKSQRQCQTLKHLTL